MMAKNGFLLLVLLVGMGQRTAVCNALEPISSLPRISFQKEKARLQILVGGQPSATYVWKDPKIPRPYFCNIRVPGGPQVTRNHPLVRGKDLMDHPTYHPGLWLAFGDISGNDYWRNRARVRHEGFLVTPKGGAGHGTFAVRNAYLTRDGKGVVCREVCHFTVHIRPAGTLLVWDSRFTPAGKDRGKNRIVFGDQEEMGLGVRMASSLTVVRKGGRILNSDGKKNEKQVWGKQALWCDYSGMREGQWVGVTLMPDPRNFRPSWFHARNYGLLLANPFGRNAFTRGKKSQVPVASSETLRLRFGVLIHASKDRTSPDLSRAYKDFLAIIRR